jgi:hypothetical protein
MAEIMNYFPAIALAVIRLLHYPGGQVESESCTLGTLALPRGFHSSSVLLRSLFIRIKLPYFQVLV